MLKKIISDRRLRDSSITTIMNILNQVVVVVTGLVSIPVILNYAGTENFALWIILTTALSFVSFSVLGVGVGVQDFISKNLTNDTDEGVCKIFTTSLVILTSISIILFILFSLHFYLTDKGAIYYAVILVFSLGIVSGLITRVYYAIQKAFYVVAISLLSRCLSFFLLFILIYYDVDFSVIVFFIGVSAYLFVIIFALPFLMYRWKNYFKFSVKYIDFNFFKSIVGVGVLGFFSGISMYLINNTIPFLLSLKYEPSVVASFSVIYKI